MVRSQKYDVIIAGAGPAGSSLAIRLAQTGRSVLLIEKSSFPRPKLCGEFISPECLPCFAELGMLEKIDLAGCNLKQTAFYSNGGRSVAVPSEWFRDGSAAVGLSRAVMDNLLLERARDAGTEVMPGTEVAAITDVDLTTRSVRVKRHGSETEFTTGLLIDATGRARAVSRIAAPMKAMRADFVAFKNHFTNVELAKETCEIYSYRDGYGGCLRVENDLYNLCFIVRASAVKRFGGNADQVMQKVVKSNKRAAVTLIDAKTAADWLAVPISRYGRAELAPAEGILAIGDAGAFIDPFTGSGILMALESAKIAAECICRAEGNFDALSADYKKQHAAAFNERLQFSSILRHAAFMPAIADTLIATLSHSPFLASRFTRRLRPT